MAELWQLVPKSTLHHLSFIYHLSLLYLQLKIQSSSVEAGKFVQYNNNKIIRIRYIVLFCTYCNNPSTQYSHKGSTWSLEKSQLFATFNPEMAPPVILKKCGGGSVFNFFVCQKLYFIIMKLKL